MDLQLLDTNCIIKKDTTVKPNGIYTANNFSNSFSIYPNPISHQQQCIVSWKSSTQQPTNIELTTISGVLVFQQTTNGIINKIKLDVAQLQLSAGIYLVSVTTSNGKWTKKLVVQ